MRDPSGSDNTAEMARVEAAARLAAIVESSDDAIVSKNLDGIIQSWNAGAQRIFGWSADEVIGKPITIIIPPERLDEETQILKRLRVGERIDHFETVRRAKDGREVNISVTISPVRDREGRIVGASKVARDITKLKEYEREREALLAAERAARVEAERAGRMKDDFLATLSHELRTPLNAILGYAQLMLQGKMPQEQFAEGIQIIERNARSQTQIIEDLLDLSRIISGKIRLDVQRLDLSDVVNAAIDTVKPLAEGKGVKLIAVIDPLIKPVKGDPARLQQVVWNLLTNAIKFTPMGGRVQIALERVNSHVEIAISDNGEGISPEFLPHVFDRFRQADSSPSTRRYKGLGIGLAIVKQLVELHSGEVRAKSPGLGQGSTFVVVLPLSAAHEDESEKPRVHPKAVSQPNDPCDGVDLSGIHVLIVDDEPDARELITRILRACDAEVSSASSTDEALELIGRRPPDVLISDLGLPDRDGFDLIRAVRALPAEAGGGVPAATLSAFARSEDRRRAMMSGFQTHIAKPVEPSELIAVVASLAGRVGRGNS